MVKAAAIAAKKLGAFGVDKFFMPGNWTPGTKLSTVFRDGFNVISDVNKIEDPKAKKEALDMIANKELVDLADVIRKSKKDIEVLEKEFIEAFKVAAGAKSGVQARKNAERKDLHDKGVSQTIDIELEMFLESEIGEALVREMLHNSKLNKNLNRNQALPTSYEDGTIINGKRRKDTVDEHQYQAIEHAQTKIKLFKAIKNARLLLILADSITTDHISPAGSIQKSGPAGDYFMQHQVLQKDFNSYGARRGNHEVMMRGTFANIRIKNEMAPGTEGGVTMLHPDKKVMPVFDASMEYQKRKVDLVVIAGKEYGTGSSRDWAAKGTKLLGVKAVIAESFERIHRSNLVGMGILPLQFKEGFSRKTLNLKGSEIINILNVEQGLKPREEVTVEFLYEDGSSKKINVLSRIDTDNETEYYKHGGILQYVLRNMA